MSVKLQFCGPAPRDRGPLCAGLVVGEGCGGGISEPAARVLGAPTAFFYGPLPVLVLFPRERLDLTARVCPRIPSAADAGITIRFPKTSLFADSLGFELLWALYSPRLSVCSLNLSPGLTSLPAAPRVCGGGKAPTPAPFVSVAPSWGGLGRDSGHPRRG